MSTVPAGNPSDQPQRSSHQPGTLAILTATAIGGVIATRMGKTPILLAAGAAAIALLKQRRVETPRPAPQLEAPAQSQVEQWLSRQITREEQAPAVDFTTASLPSFEPEDDYRPQSFLLDDADEVPSLPPSAHSFARLTDPVPVQIPTPAPQLEPVIPPPPPQAQETPPTRAADAAWTLGVEPLPSLNEGAPLGASTSGMFFTAPVRQEDFEPQPVFSIPVFEGAAFPDEINVAPAFDPASSLTAETPPSDLAPTPETEPQSEEPPAAAPAPEIFVQIAAPGDASFDPPLAAAPHNPWQTEPDVFATAPAPPAQTQMPSPIVEAEIILRPRAPTQNAVVTKSKFAPPSFGKHFTAESSDTPPVEGENDAHFPGPLQSPREPSPRSTWRSWWRGD